MNLWSNIRRWFLISSAFLSSLLSLSVAFILLRSFTLPNASRLHHREIILTFCWAQSRASAQWEVCTRPTSLTAVLAVATAAAPRAGSGSVPTGMASEPPLIGRCAARPTAPSQW